MVEQRAREQVAEREAGKRRKRAEQQRLEREDHEHLSRVEPLRAQLGDEAPALGDRQQHRVQGQQQADHRADRGEERRRLVVGLCGEVEQPQFLIGRCDREPAGRERLQLAGHLRLLSGLRLDEQLRHAAGLVEQGLHDGERGDADRALRERADGVRPEHRADLDALLEAIGEQRHMLAAAHADGRGDARWKREAVREPQATRAEVAR